MSAEDLEILRILQEGRDWIWVNGNHDPEISATLGGHVTGDPPSRA
jgi:metallophosphoesterase superfamily enzyme